MVVIDYIEFVKYGCVNCGCDRAGYKNNFKAKNAEYAKCLECGTEYIILLKNAENGEELNFSIDENGEINFGQSMLKGEHPRKGIPWHPWSGISDPKPRFSIGDYVYNKVARRGSYEPSICNKYSEICIESVRKCGDTFFYICGYNGYKFKEDELMSEEEYKSML